MYLHPTADVSSSAEIGPGTKVWHYAQIRENVRIGQECILGKSVYVDEEVVIGDRVKIQNRASIYKDCLIEDGVFIGPHVCFTNDRVPRAINLDGSLKDADDWQPGRTIVGRGASIGAGAIILPGKLIGRFAMVGAGSVVTRDVPDHALVVGNPAKIVGYVCACGARVISSEDLVCDDCKGASLRAAASGGDRNELTVAVVGLGKVGLPLAVQYASHGARVIGCDISPAVVECVNRGVSPIGEENNLAERLAEAHARGRIRAVTDTVSGVREANVVIIIVPLMVDDDRTIDFRVIDAATRSVGQGLEPGTLVVYETTLPVGTTRNRFATILAEQSGMTPGVDFFLAFSPERIRTGRIFQDLATYPKVVGGINEESTNRVEAFYRAVLDAPVMRVRDAETAEFTKLAETSYRDVNIALANELAVYAAARGIDMAEATAAANSQPQSDIHAPGVGVGGHCIPVYPYFLLQDAEPGELHLARDARMVNDGMSVYAVDQLEAELGDLSGKSVVILGATYRGDVKEVAFTTAKLLNEELARRGAQVSIHDPLLSDDEIIGLGGHPVALDGIQSPDAMIIQAAHSEYLTLPEPFFRKARVVMDGRGSVDPSGMDLGDTVWLRIGSPPLMREIAEATVRR